MADATGFNEAIPLSIYVHIPWCVRKCPYCDFNSHAQHNRLPEQRYVNTLLRDLDQKLPLIWGRRIESVFIGGGTPSLFSASALEQIISGLRQRLPLRPDTEITMEANPGTFEAEKFCGFRDAGINRLSIGIQSFNDQHLEVLGRIHSAEEAKRAVAIAREAGFENINLDLMFALPGQTLSQSADDLRQALALNPEHISFYQLTIEPNTAFYVSPPPVPEDDLSWEMQEQGISILANGGYHQYEVSAYSKPGRQCRHNRNYWEFGDYLAIGAGGHGKLTLPQENRIERHWNVRHPGEYMNAVALGDGISGRSDIAKHELDFEFMLNTLRLKDGVESEVYKQRTNKPLDDLAGTLALARARGLMAAVDNRLMATPEGYQYLNELIMMFMGEPDAN